MKVEVTWVVITVLNDSRLRNFTFSTTLAPRAFAASRDPAYGHFPDPSSVRNTTD